MKRLASLLVLAALICALALPAAADVAYMPRDNFIEKHWDECSYVNRWFWTNGEAGYVLAHKTPDSKEATPLPNGGKYYISNVYQGKWGVLEYDPGTLELKKDMKVIVEAAWGTEFGTVVYIDKELPEDADLSQIKKVVRIATADDLEREGRNRQKEAAAYDICLEKIAKHGLAMKLVAVEYTFDGNKILFYFTADGRIDFRELVKDLASVFHTRIELRQIGVRDETKILGGLGICGRVLCCHSYLSEFSPVSIRMAKDQNLSLNPTKISGACGRLMCCLKNEEETYEYLNSKLPGIGDTVVIRDGGIKGTVKDINVLRQQVSVLITGDDDTDIRTVHVNEISFQNRRKARPKLSAEEIKEMKELEAMEKGDKDGSKLD